MFMHCSFSIQLTHFLFTLLEQVTFVVAKSCKRHSKGKRRTHGGAKAIGGMTRGRVKESGGAASDGVNMTGGAARGGIEAVEGAARGGAKAS
jgi:hypothetical protein